jgi:flagellar protein FliO/FliZ
MSEASSPSLLGTALSLLAVLALFVGAAWLARRSRPMLGAKGNGPALKAVASLSLGTRERVVIVEAAGQWLVLGVAPGSVRPLHSLPRPEGVEAGSPEPVLQTAFAQVFARFGGGNAK